MVTKINERLPTGTGTDGRAGRADELGLDPLVQQTFYEILQEENKRGMTIFLSSHVLGEVQKLCSRVAILREGKLVRVQSMETLRGNGYKKIALTVFYSRSFIVGFRRLNRCGC